MMSKSNKKPTLTAIKNFVVSNGGSYKKQKFTLGGKDAYRVNGQLLTKNEMQEMYDVGGLL